MLDFYHIVGMMCIGHERKAHIAEAGEFNIDIFCHHDIYHYHYLPAIKYLYTYLFLYFFLSFLLKKKIILLQKYLIRRLRFRQGTLIISMSLLDVQMGHPPFFLPPLFQIFWYCLP